MSRYFNMVTKLIPLMVAVAVGLTAGCSSVEPVLEIDSDWLDRQESLGMEEIDRYTMCSNAVEICPSLEVNIPCPELAQRGAIVRKGGTIYICPEAAFSGLSPRYDRCSTSGTY